uniref:Uncharacterized protein n=1 Tax=Chenopodium quinoa TaxID=63459 RepID=A0A803N5T4_CHEQI
MCCFYKTSGESDDITPEILDELLRVANEAADAADGCIVEQATNADPAAEDAMISLILQNFPHHVVFGEERGWLPEGRDADFVWVLDPIDGTTSFKNGIPLFGTLIALLYKSKPVQEPIYGAECFTYGLLASGFVDLIIQSFLGPYDFLAFIPIIEGAGGIITDCAGQKLEWKASPLSIGPAYYRIIAAGDKQVHQDALEYLTNV